MKSHVVVESDNRIFCTAGGLGENYQVPTIAPTGDRCFELDDTEALWIAYLLQRAHHIYYFDPDTRQITNDKGEVMIFNPQTGNSYAHAKDDNVKQYVDMVSPTEASIFLETLKDIKIKELEYKELESQIHSKYAELQESVQKHMKTVSELHDKLCKILAISGYNEFKNKIFVEPDGKVYIINKDINIELKDL